MYKIICDGFPILDLRDEDYIVESPIVRMEVNTVGSASFKIYSNHPYYEGLKKLKSIFEIRDDFGVIFRGRMTDDTKDFINGKSVDLEGVLAYFNDSLITPFNFPVDFLEYEEYLDALKNGNVIEYFLKWIIEQHNSQVQEFQKFKLGTVTVTDPNNYLSRSSIEYLSAWEVLKTKLFESELGGYLCIRYEDDGNYIDYLADFTAKNEQAIEFGENLLDFKQEMDASSTYTAIMPFGAELEVEKADGTTEKARITIDGIADGYINEDIIKSGGTLYSVSGVETYGWIYAPVAETTWNDVTLVDRLLTKATAYLSNTALQFSDTIEISAADLHYTDSEIMSFRIYKTVDVVSKPHGLSATYKLSSLEIPLLEPQNSKITVGETKKTLISMQNDEQANAVEAAKEALKKASATDKAIANWCHENDETMIDGSKIYAGSIYAKQLNVENAQLELVTSDYINALKIIAQSINATTGKIGGFEIEPHGLLSAYDNTFATYDFQDNPFSDNIKIQTIEGYEDIGLLTDFFETRFIDSYSISAESPTVDWPYSDFKASYGSNYYVTNISNVSLKLVPLYSNDGKTVSATGSYNDITTEEKNGTVLSNYKYVALGFRVIATGKRVQISNESNWTQGDYSIDFFSDTYPNVDATYMLLSTTYKPKLVIRAIDSGKAEITPVFFKYGSFAVNCLGEAFVDDAELEDLWAANILGGAANILGGDDNV